MVFFSLVVVFFEKKKRFVFFFLLVSGVNQLTSAVDTYSFGVLLWELWSEEIPFNGLGLLQVAQDVVANQRRPEISSSSSSIDASIDSLVRRCWSQEPQARPTMATVLAELQQYWPSSNVSTDTAAPTIGPCVVCIDRLRVGVFVPCGHVACCLECAMRLTACPVCNLRDSYFMRMYVV